MGSVLGLFYKHEDIFQYFATRGWAAAVRVQSVCGGTLTASLCLFIGVLFFLLLFAVLLNCTSQPKVLPFFF